ncbi:hypothetical protein DRN58_08585 [Thermococci archaeon]|nr:MAG: hypothetical protein DRN58_08585 [Thermococci archaeon]
MIEIIFYISIIAFFCEYIDSTLGMGYGTTLTPLLLLIGYSPLEIVPAVLLSEFVTGISAGFFHHQFKNVDLNTHSNDFKVASVLAICSIVGVIIAVFLAVNIPKKILKLYIGILVLVIGILILMSYNKTYIFSWKKIIGIGTLASFNKGISGGGYGPLVCGGQILSGVDAKPAIGITSFAEGLTCFVGVIIYLLSGYAIPWGTLTPSIVLGSVLSVPFATYTVSKINTKKMKLLIGVSIITLGIFTISKTIGFF